MAKDLIVLTADKDATFALSAILERHQALGIRDVTFDVYSHPQRDSGCRLRGHTFLRSRRSDYTHALQLFDVEGCGREGVSREQLELEAETRLRQSGWGDGAAAIVIAPELESWVWSGSTHVARALGWTDEPEALSAWLAERFDRSPDSSKPSRPKEAMEAALREVRKPWSSAIHRQIASHVSLRTCVDPGFDKLKSTLQSWFPRA